MLDKIKKIEIELVGHKDQRYETVGDYYLTEDGTMKIRCSRMDDVRHSFLVAVHELVEVLLVGQDGVKEEDITAFDVTFERAREPGNIDEPGDDPSAPYVRQHCFATAVERMMCAALGCSWKEYDAAVNALSQD